MENKESTDNIVSSKYLSFVLMYKRKKVSLLNIDQKECTLYDQLGNAFLNTYLTNFRDKKLKLRLVKDAGNWQIESNREIFINGVAWRKRVLRDGDKIYLGEYRLIFEGNFVEEIPKTQIKRKSSGKKKLLRLLEAGVLICSVSFLWYCTTINHNSNERIKLADKRTSSMDHESELPYNFSEELDGLDEIDSDVHLKDRIITPVIVYAPEDDLFPQKLDILFIHSHPDDESLDYGLYMAEASEAGKSIGIIIFTDGDSGFDKYPDRPVEGFYKDAHLEGSDLAGVRIQEAEKALTVLGAKVYLRMGLWNRAYTVEEASKSTDTLISEWGGYNYLIDKLVAYMEIFQPDIIVSPDGPCGAREHFEHEAVGLISNMAVNRYRERNPGILEAYLNLVDVQQTEAYQGVPLLYIGAGDNNQYKDLKKSALMMHQTQADASYYGIKRLEDFPVEYYIVQYLSDSPVNSTLALLDDKMVEKFSSQTY